MAVMVKDYSVCDWSLLACNAKELPLQMYCNQHIRVVGLVKAVTCTEVDQLVNIVRKGDLNAVEL